MLHSSTLATLIHAVKVDGKMQEVFPEHVLASDKWLQVRHEGHYWIEDQMLQVRSTFATLIHAGKMDAKM